MSKFPNIWEMKKLVIIKSLSDKFNLSKVKELNIPNNTSLASVKTIIIIC